MCKTQRMCTTEIRPGPNSPAPRRRARDPFSHRPCSFIPLLAVLLPLVLVSLAAAARLVLKNGQTIEGLIVDDVPGDYITIRTGGSALRFDYSRIQSIDRETTHAVEEQLGDQLAKQKKYKEALDHYLAAKETHRASPGIDAKINQMQKRIEEQELAQYGDQIQAAQTLLNEGSLAEAEKQLKNLRDSVKLESVKKRATQMLARLHYLKAQRAMDVVDYVTAEQELRIAIKEDPELAVAHIELGDLYNSRQLGKSQALQEYETALKLGGDQLKDKQKNRVRWSIARIAMDTEDWPLALKYFKAVYDSDPRYDPRLLDNLTNAFLKRANTVAPDKPDEAVSLLRQGLKYQPGETDIMYRLVQLLVQQNRCKEALEEVNALLAIDYQYPNAHYLAAQCLKREGKVLDARSELQAEIRVDPKHIDALIELGDISFEGGAFNDARGYYAKALDIDPGRVAALLGTAKVLRRTGDLPAARRYIELILETYPDNRAANLEMGSILKDEKNYTKAKDFFDKVIESLQKEEKNLNYNDTLLLADALDRRGEIFLLLDQPRTARNDFEESLKYEPNYGQTYYNIGQSYIKEGTDEATLLKAEKNLLKARKLDPKSPQFAQGLGIFYQQYMSQRDIPDSQKKAYLRKAVENYNDYLKLGGTDIENVKKWIEESGGTVDKD